VFLETDQRRLHVKLENYFKELSAMPEKILAKSQQSKVKEVETFRYHLKISKSV